MATGKSVKPDDLGKIGSEVESAAPVPLFGWGGTDI
jgi:hypothetical protein